MLIRVGVGLFVEFAFILTEVDVEYPGRWARGLRRVIVEVAKGWVVWWGRWFSSNEHLGFSFDEVAVTAN